MFYPGKRQELTLRNVRKKWQDLFSTGYFLPVLPAGIPPREASLIQLIALRIQGLGVVDPGCRSCWVELKISGLGVFF